MPSATTPAQNPWIKPALELGPLLLFFVVYSRWNLFAATGVLMAASVVSLAVTWTRERRLPVMPLVTAGLVLVLGGLTLWLKDDTFIKLKVTIVNALFGLVLVIGLLLRKQPIKVLFGEALRLTDAGWSAMTRAWIGYFLGIAALNELVWRNTSTDTWVKFKTFALPIATVVFFLALSPLLARHAEPEHEHEHEAE